MASNDYYYNSKSLPNPNPSRTPDPSSPYQSSAYGAPSSYSNPPAYSSQPYLPDTGVGGSGGSSRPAQAGGPSPFETVFDDHVYPMNGQRTQTPSGSMHDPYSRHQDTAYYGGGGGGSRPGDMGRMNSDDRMGSSADDIPLQNRHQQPVNKDPEANDHVYDVNGPEGAAAGGGPHRQRSERKIRFGELGMLGSGKKKIAWVCYFFSIVQVAVFIGEIVKNAQLTGSPIMIKPQFNPMIGPSTYVLINMGARYVVCMHNVDKVQNSVVDLISWPCPNTTTTDAACTLSDLCGFGGVPEPQYGKFPGVPVAQLDKANQPNQWWRFIVPIFMHAGLIHIGFNLLLQLTIGREMEMSIGSIRFFLVYISAGIFGFVMGGNFAATGVASTGASGSLFGIIALTLLDLLYSWRDRKNPMKDLLFILLDVAISFVLGLLPGLDNFSHIGGFLMGLALGICLLHSPNSLRRRIGVDAPPYSTLGSGQSSQTAPPFYKNPIGFFKGRKPLWWVWWLVRAGALLLVFISFILLLQNFYNDRKTCDWCKYLSCIQINDWCDMGNLKIENKTTPNQTPAKPNLFLL